MLFNFIIFFVFSINLFKFVNNICKKLVLFQTWIMRIVILSNIGWEKTFGLYIFKKNMVYYLVWFNLEIV